MPILAFRTLFKTIPCRLFSQTCILPYDIDQFNGVRVRNQEWPNDIEIIRNSLSGLCSIPLHSLEQRIFVYFSFT